MADKVWQDTRTDWGYINNFYYSLLKISGDRERAKAKNFK